MISPGGHAVPDASRPLATCNTHSGVEIETTLTRHYPSMEQALSVED
jgi:hypothetical protein